MSTTQGNAGGPTAIRGYLVQTLVALLEITQADPPFTEITLEPSHAGEQFDFVWRNANGSFAVQVKSTINEFKKPAVEDWAAKLQAARKNETCSLMLVGNYHTSLAKIDQIGAVIIEKKNLDIPSLYGQAAHLLASFIEAQSLDAGTAIQREMVTHSLVSRLLNYSVTREPLTRDAFIKLMTVWIKEAPRQKLIIDISRIMEYAPAELIGRDDELIFLNNAWSQAVKGEPKRPRVLTFVALGGEGKTSLVSKWAAELAHCNLPGCEAVFAWSFYSQGTQEQTTATSDLFLKEALEFFGDAEMADSARHASDKGKRLAQLVREKRALLILDGVEPLQYPPMPPMDGKLKDDGLAALLKGLAASSLGLCVVTTRYSIPDLKAYRQGNAPEISLNRLSKKAGIKLLKSLGVNGIQGEFEKLVEDVRGHALTLNLLGSYLHDAHVGDIRQRDLVKLGEADAEEQGGHAFRTMDAYVQWFESGGKNAEEIKSGQRMLSVLRLLGLFDRPASADCLAELFKAPAIPNLTEALLGTSKAHRNMVYTRLENANLITVNRDTARTLLSVDAHPLLREYFAKQLREQHPDSWREAHRRLYEYLCATTNEGNQPTLEDLQPLYQAVAHGCQAGMQQDAFEKVYFKRIQRGAESGYSTKKLGAVGFDLGAVACFFDILWSLPSATLSKGAQGWLMNQASIDLRTLGRLTEATELLRTAISRTVKDKEWQRAAVGASNLSQLELALGEVNDALSDGERAVTYADLGGYGQSAFRACHANAMFQLGQESKAMECFYEAERIQAETQPEYPLLFSIWGFNYCDFLLDVPERAAWLSFLHLQEVVNGAEEKVALDACSKVSERATETLRWVEINNTSLLDMGLDHLTLGRSALYAAQLTDDSSSQYAIACEHIGAAMKLLRLAEVQEFVVSGLLTRTWLRSLEGKHTGSNSAQTDLDEAWEIAERGPMPLFMADIHLHRARLFFRETTYPWSNPDGTPRNAKHDLGDARRLIEKHGYLRRMEELEDAERVIGK